MHNRLPQGFTALELMVTLSIVSILLAAGIPSLQQFTWQQHLKAAISSLHNDLMMARNKAVYLNSDVVACPGTPADGCLGANDWAGGWIVFVDANTDRQRQSEEALVRHGQGFENTRIQSSAGRTDVRFLPNGSSPGSNASITFCGLQGPEKARKLVISNLGRIRRDTAPGIDPSLCPM
jgi:type IV fimbrial biogenesis protein FimT